MIDIMSSMVWQPIDIIKYSDNLILGSKIKARVASVGKVC